MRIYIRTVVGRMISVEIDANDTIADLKERIQEKEGVTPDDQRLVLGDTELAGDATVADCGIVEDNTAHVILLVRAN